MNDQEMGQAGGAALATGGTGTDSDWEELVTTALLGLDRRGAPRRPSAAGTALAETAALLDDADPALAVLDLAALHTVHQRAGLRPAAARPRPEPAPVDPRPPLPRAARHRLATLLADRSSPGGGVAPNLSELLPQWLFAAREHGYRAPEALLPDLLEIARTRSDLRRDALALAGPRGLWLAAANPSWKYALRAGIAPVASGEDEADQKLWEEGLFAERMAMLSQLRARDAGAALSLLRSTWSTERAEDRLLFLDALRTGLCLDDEPFLEGALADRSKNVRVTAAELLSSLPGSALAARMAERARVCVGPETVDGAVRVLVRAPQECDAAMQRDGISPKPPTNRGKRAWWLGQLVESAPLPLWTELFGLPPEKIVALPVADDWRNDLHAAWSRAAVRQRDATWARALLGAPFGDLASEEVPAEAPKKTRTIRRPPDRHWIGRGARGNGPNAYRAGTAGMAGDPAKLLSVLPAAERARWVAGFIRRYGLPEAFQMLGVCAVPWAEPLGRAVVNALAAARDGGHYPWSYSTVIGLAERCLDPELAPWVDALATPAKAAHAAGARSHWSEAFQRLINTLRLRATMLAELAADGAPPDADGGSGG